MWKFFPRALAGVSMSDTQNKPIPFTDRVDPGTRAEGMMRVVEALLHDPKLSEEDREALRNNEIIQRIKSALAQNG
jgi:hypothetical protein